LIKRMLRKDPEERVGWKELFEHPRIVKAVRTERRKEITSMEEFKRSLIFVNKSITKIEEFAEKESRGPKEEESCLILE
jgi:serine/threonine protein kinase